MKIIRPKVLRYWGRSMWPCFQDGDLLELMPVELAQIKAGDCIAYTTHCGEPTVHRVVTAGNDLITRGDAMPVVDKNSVGAEQILGRIICRYRFGRTSRVSQGIYGQLAGIFYYYAGRLDPTRTSRGGRLACFISRFTTRFFNILRINYKKERLARGKEPDLVVLKFRKVIVGRQDPVTAAWTISWPWSILLNIRDTT